MNPTLTGFRRFPNTAAVAERVIGGPRTTRSNFLISQEARADRRPAPEPAATRIRHQHWHGATRPFARHWCFNLPIGKNPAPLHKLPILQTHSAAPYRAAELSSGSGPLACVHDRDQTRSFPVARASRNSEMKPRQIIARMTAAIAGQIRM